MSQNPKTQRPGGRGQSRSVDMMTVQEQHAAGLRPWQEVARLYNQRSGEKLSDSRCWQIAMDGLRKLRRGLSGRALR